MDHVTAADLNAAQLRTVQALCHRITDLARFRTQDDWLNGPVVFELRPGSGSGNVYLVATNSTDERRWFETALLVMVSIGPRGGRDVFHSEGLLGSI